MTGGLFNISDSEYTDYFVVVWYCLSDKQGACLVHWIIKDTLKELEEDKG